jgi:hypothetical protein
MYVKGFIMLVPGEVSSVEPCRKFWGKVRNETKSSRHDHSSRDPRSSPSSRTPPGLIKTQSF